QADLLQAMYGRHGESPIPIVASYSPAQCFDAAIEAARIALKYRTPVLLLSDGYLANGSEPWRLPSVADLPDISVEFATEPNHTGSDGELEFWPYLRDPLTLARPWAVPGTEGLAHRIGGIEKEDGTGNISYDPANHEHMVQLRADKIAGIAADIAPVEVSGDVDDAELLVVGWGSTWGAIDGAMNRCRATGSRVAHAHLTHLNPFPPNLGDVLARYPRVVVPELNLGQLSRLLRAEYLVDARSITKVQGVPFTAGELEAALRKEMDQ
ncbi:MAG: 2-oxoglutarate ferredoxin oxidoreductase subunit alpha, partial [Acidimicrobiales bacterium]|nr:2-oxoglutarate ferredoxin oxidoreductase subunit alpha [Acidimicrobiales bacterium]